MDLWKWILIILAIFIVLFFLFPSIFNKALDIVKKISNKTNNIIQGINIKANESKKIDITLPNISIQTNKSGE